MFTYSFITIPDFKIDKKIVDKILTYTSDIVSISQNGTINIVFLDNYSIKNLNNKYRKKDSVTDVLSFHYYDNFNNCKKKDIVGEIVMSENMIKKQGKEYSLGTEKEFYKLLIHSILHILGYNHEEKTDFLEMEKIENEIWDRIFGK